MQRMGRAVASPRFANAAKVDRSQARLRLEPAFEAPPPRSPA